MPDRQSFIIMIFVMLSSCSLNINFQIHKSIKALWNLHFTKLPTNHCLKDETTLPREVQKCRWASIVFMQRLLRVSQTRRVLSSLADKMNLPPGWKTTLRTQLSCPINVNKQSPVPMSHTYKT